MTQNNSLSDFVSKIKDVFGINAVVHIHSFKAYHVFSSLSCPYGNMTKMSKPNTHTHICDTLYVTYMVFLFVSFARECEQAENKKKKVRRQRVKRKKKKKLLKVK